MNAASTKSKPLHHRCSRFFALAPQSIGSGLQESFASYLDRLSAAHSAPLQPFLRKIVCASAGWRGVDPKSHTRKLLVGYGEAGSVLDFVAEETTVEEVHELAPAFFRNYAFAKPNLRGTSAWCPTCLNEWQESGAVMYRPLIWSIALVNYCPVHCVEIMTRCPQCTSQIDYLGPVSWNGECPNCGSWLGKGRRTRALKCRPSDVERRRAHLFASVLCSDKGLTNVDELTVFKKNLDVAVEIVGVNAFCRMTKFSKKSLQAWRKARRKPQLTSLLRLSCCFGVALNKWVSAELTHADFQTSF